MEDLQSHDAQLLTLGLHPRATWIPKFQSHLWVIIFRGRSQLTLQKWGKFRLAPCHYRTLIKSLEFNNFFFFKVLLLSIVHPRLFTLVLLVSGFCQVFVPHGLWSGAEVTLPRHSLCLQHPSPCKSYEAVCLKTACLPALSRLASQHEPSQEGCKWKVLPIRAWPPTPINTARESKRHLHLEVYKDYLASA